MLLPRLTERNGLTHDDIAWIVPHQANLRIIDATAKRLGVDMEKVMIEYTRNTEIPSSRDNPYLPLGVGRQTEERR